MVPSNIGKIFEDLKHQCNQTKILPPSTLISGERGVGKSWLFFHYYKHLLMNKKKNHIHPLYFGYQLSAQSLIESINRKIYELESESILSKKNDETATDKFILFVENIDKLFGNIKSANPKQSSIKGRGINIYKSISHASALRSFLLQQHGKISLFATAESIEFMLDEELPFYNYFNLIEITPFNPKESFDYLKKKIQNEELELLNLMASIKEMDFYTLTEGKMSFLNEYSSSINIASRGKKKTNIDYISSFLSDYFQKTSIYIQSELDNLSAREKEVLDKLVHLPNEFTTNDIDIIRKGPTLNATLDTLTHKNILSVNKLGNKKTFIFKKSLLKTWLKLYPKTFDTNELKRAILSN